MKILLFNREYFPIVGGAGTVSKDLAEEWIRQGHFVVVVAGSAPGAVFSEKLNGVLIYRVPTFSTQGEMTMACAAWYLVLGFFIGLFLMLRHRFDCVHSHFTIPSGLLGLVIAKLSMRKHALMIVGGDIYEPANSLSPHTHWLLGPLVRFTINNSDAVNAISSSTKEYALKYHAPKRPITVIPIGYPMPTVEIERVAAYESVPLVVSLSTFIPRKNLFTLLRSFAAMTSTDYHLAMIGDGPLRTELLSLITSLHIENRVHLPGFVSEQEKHGYLASADIFIHTAYHEGFGIVFQEAMFAGLPIISGNHGGQLDMLRDEENALLVDPEDEEGFTRALNRLSSDASLRKKLGEQARTDLDRFGMSKIAKEHLEQVSI